MSEKGIAKSNLIVIIAIIAVVIIVCFVMFKPKEKLEYYEAVGSSSYKGTLIEEYRIFKKMYKESGISNDMISSTTYTKYDILEHFNENYFSSKKVAVIAIYEDDAKEYIYSINDVIYNEDRTEVTIKYTDKEGGYLGTLGNVWYNYLFVELDGTVNSVNFVEDNSNSAEE